MADDLISSSRSSEVSLSEMTTPEDDDTPEGFAEIEKAFSSISMVADSILDSIHSDSMRDKERKREKKSSSPGRRSPGRKSPTRKSYVIDSDEDVKEEERKLPSFHEEEEEDDVLGTTPFTSSYSAIHHNEDHSDVSSLDMTLGDGDESIDGSLVHDVHNLRSSTKAMAAELQKQEESFHANVTEGCNGKSFFQKLEETKAREEAKTLRKKNKYKQQRPLTTISVRNSSNGNGRVPVMSPQNQAQEAPLWDQLQPFCEELLGKSPNLPLLAVTFAIWLFLFRLIYVAKDGLIDGEGSLRVALTS